MSDVLDPVKLGHHLLFFLQILLILLCLVDFILLKFLFDLVDFLVEESANIRLLFYQYFRGFVLNSANVIENLFVQFANLMHPISVGVIQ